MEPEAQKTTIADLPGDILKYLSNFNSEVICEVRTKKKKKYLVIIQRDSRIPEKMTELRFKLECLSRSDKENNREDIEIIRKILNDKTKSKEEWKKEHNYLSLKYESVSGILYYDILDSCFHARSSPIKIILPAIATIPILNAIKARSAIDFCECSDPEIRKNHTSCKEKSP